MPTSCRQEVAVGWASGSPKVGVSWLIYNDVSVALMRYLSLLYRVGELARWQDSSLFAGPGSRGYLCGGAASVEALGADRRHLWWPYQRTWQRRHQGYRRGWTCLAAAGMHSPLNWLLLLFCDMYMCLLLYIQAVTKERSAKRVAIRNVLVVDDAMLNRKMVCRLLNNLGCRFTEATNGSEAVVVRKNEIIRLIRINYC